MTRGEPLPTALPYLEDDVIDTTPPEETAAPPQEAEAAPPPEQETETAPLADEPQAPAPEPQQPDISTQFSQLMEMQRQNIELQRQQYQQPQQPQQYVPLEQRPEWRERYENALSSAAYDESARRDLMTMQNELVREQVQQAIQPMQQQIGMEMRGEQVLRSSYAQMQQQYGAGVSQDDYYAVANDVFGGNRAALTQALDPSLNPNAAATQRILAEAAAGRALLSGRLRPAAPAENPPPAPRGAARTATPAAQRRTTVDQWNDPEYLESIDLYELARRPNR